MNDELRRTMEEWLASDDPVKQAHARHRLSAPPPPQYPPVTTQLANAAGALVRAVASGFSRVTPEEHARRKAICEGCEYYDDTQQRCRKCGCVASIKAWLNSEACPAGRW